VEGSSRAMLYPLLGPLVTAAEADAVLFLVCLSVRPLFVCLFVCPSGCLSGTFGPFVPPPSSK